MSCFVGSLHSNNYHSS